MRWSLVGQLCLLAVLGAEGGSGSGLRLRGGSLQDFRKPAVKQPEFKVLHKHRPKRTAEERKEDKWATMLPKGPTPRKGKSKKPHRQNNPNYILKNMSALAYSRENPGSDSDKHQWANLVDSHEPKATMLNATCVSVRVGPIKKKVDSTHYPELMWLLSEDNKEMLGHTDFALDRRHKASLVTYKEIMANINAPRACGRRAVPFFKCSLHGVWRGPPIDVPVDSGAEAAKAAKQAAKAERKAGGAGEGEKKPSLEGISKEARKRAKALERKKKEDEITKKMGLHTDPDKVIDKYLPKSTTVMPWKNTKKKTKLRKAKVEYALHGWKEKAKKRAAEEAGEEEAAEKMETSEYESYQGDSKGATWPYEPGKRDATKRGKKIEKKKEEPKEEVAMADEGSSEEEEEEDKGKRSASAKGKGDKADKKDNAGDKKGGGDKKKEEKKEEDSLGGGDDDMGFGLFD